MCKWPHSREREREREGLARVQMTLDSCNSLELLDDRYGGQGGIDVINQMYQMNGCV